MSENSARLIFLVASRRASCRRAHADATPFRYRQQRAIPSGAGQLRSIDVLAGRVLGHAMPAKTKKKGAQKRAPEKRERNLETRKLDSYVAFVLRLYISFVKR